MWLLFFMEDSHNVILLLSDGGSLDLAPVLKEAVLTKQAGIDIAVGAVGNWIDMNEVLLTHGNVPVMTQTSNNFIFNCIL